MNNNHGRRRVRRARRQAKANVSRILLTICMMALVAVVSIGGTLAWLTAETDTITNTFSPSNIGLKLEESTGTDYQFVPGKDITKDPTVTVTNDVDAYVFVKIAEQNWPDWLETDGITPKVSYEIAGGWTELDDETGVYYCIIGANDANKVLGVLANNTITVSNSITNADMNKIDTANKPALKFTAYAIQVEGFSTPALAWAEVSK